MKKKTKVLIVEDERITAYYMEKVLESNGFQVTGNVSSGMDAIRSVEEELPAVILMDILINGEYDGIRTAVEIRKKHNVSIIFTSANIDQVDLARFNDSGKIVFLTKPINNRELINKIMELAG